MAISNVINTNFRLSFHSNFIYKEVEEEFKPSLKDKTLMFTRLIDYLNSTITDAEIPGFIDVGTKEQVVKQGDIRTFPGALKFKQQQSTKELTVTFQLKNDYLNWLIMMRQFWLQIEKKERKNENDQGTTFLEPIRLQVLDDYGNINFEMLYTQIRIVEIEKIRLQMQNVTLSGNQFTVRFSFNEFDYKNRSGERSQYTREEFQY